MVQEAYGPIDNLRMVERDKPSPAGDAVLIRVRAAGVDPGIWHLMTGRPYMMRLMGLGFSRPKVPVAGWDAAGVVEAVGPNVTRFKPGDEVFGICKGAFAEYVCAPESGLAIKPESLTFEQAASVPVAARRRAWLGRSGGEAPKRVVGVRRPS